MGRRTVQIGDVSFRPSTQVLLVIALLSRNPGHVHSGEAVCVAAHASANQGQFPEHAIISRVRKTLVDAGLPDYIGTSTRNGYYWDDGVKTIKTR